MIVIIDFGSQTTHLIGRRLRDLGSKITITTPEEALSVIEKENPNGVVLSGGPSSVYEKNAPTIDKAIFDLPLPKLAICYGFQLGAKFLGGKVVPERKEYGPAILTVKDHTSALMNGVGETFTVWMSHGDEITSLPSSFESIASTDHVPYAASINKEKNLYGLLFHPEIEHTEYGTEILTNFLKICGVSLTPHTHDIEGMIESIRKTVGKKHVIGAISGGVDSTVAGVLTAKAIGKQFTPIFVDNGLMRPDAAETVKKIFTEFGITPIICEVADEMLEKLKGVSDSEAKRKIIGAFYIEVFEREMAKLVKKDHDVAFLLQGTIYSDVIESKGTRHAEKIKSHHNVGGLPEHMKLTVLEPLRDLYKDEVRMVGEKLDLPSEFVWKQVFPGPGYAVRIRGEVTKKRLDQVKMADMIVLEELRKADLLKTIYMSFPVMTGAESTAVKGDGRFFGEVIALRIVESKDVMSSTWARLPYEVLQRMSSRIVNEVPEVSRVVYDISTKPPATMEWE